MGGMHMHAALLVSAVLSTAPIAAACSNTPSERDFSKALALSADVKTLRIVDTRAGTGEEAVPGRRVSVHYTGTLLDGQKFDSSRDRGRPIEFTLGRGEVIPGWDEGLKGMRVGGTRELTIPASMAYGSRGSGDDIPPNAALKFEVELVAVN
jgi:FKBP-type peptidyl-prolyl cis-trans isomerase FkpA